MADFASGSCDLPNDQTLISDLNVMIREPIQYGYAALECSPLSFECNFLTVHGRAFRPHMLWNGARENAMLSTPCRVSWRSSIEACAACSERVQQRRRTIQSGREFAEANAQPVDELDFLRAIKIGECEPPSSKGPRW